MLAYLAVAIVLGTGRVQAQPSYQCDIGMVAYEPNVDDCGSFWQCNNGVWISQICPTGSFWDVNSLTCAADSGVCVPSNENSPPPACAALDSHFLPDLMNCSSFTREVDGVRREYRCVAGMVFNTMNSVCDWPENYPQCAVPSETPPLHFTDPNECLMPCPSDADVVYPLVTPTEVKCGEYYVCLEGQLYTGNCNEIGNGEFLVFDATTKSCTAQMETININCPGTA